MFEAANFVSYFLVSSNKSDMNDFSTEEAKGLTICKLLRFSNKVLVFSELSLDHSMVKCVVLCLYALLCLIILTI